MSTSAVRNHTHSLLNSKEQENLSDAELTRVWQTAIESVFRKESESVLIYAIKNNLPAPFVEEFLRSGLDVNQRLSDQCTALHYACGASGITPNPEVIELLLQYGANRNLIEDQGWLALHYAARSGSHEAVELILKDQIIVDPMTKEEIESQPNYKTTINHPNAQGDTPLTLGLGASPNTHVICLLIQKGASLTIGNPLHKAIKAKLDDEMIQKLIFASQRFEADEHGLTPLHLACGASNLKPRPAIVRSLLRSPSFFGTLSDQKLEETDASDWTPLHFATKHACLDTMQLLLVNGALRDPENAESDTPLSIAMGGCNDQYTPNYQTAELLLLNWANPNVGHLLHRAFKKEWSRIIPLLLQRNADPNLAAEMGVTPLHFACGASGIKPNPNITKMLIEHGARIDLRNEAGWLPLHFAARSGCVSCVMQVARGSLVNNLSADEHTPLMLACGSPPKFYTPNPRVVSLLLGFNADPNFQHPIFYALQSGSNEVLDALLVAKPKLAIRDERGFTPLDHACGAGGLPANPYAIKALLKAGALPTTLSKEGLTPLHYAVRSGSLEAVQALMKKCNFRIMDQLSNIPLLSVACGYILEGFTPNRQIVNYLLKAKAPLNTNIGPDPLFFAIYVGLSTPIIQALLSAGARIDKRYQGGNLLHYACGRQHPNVDIIEQLLNNGLSPNEVSEPPEKVTPLHLAVRFGCLRTTTLLLEYHGDPNLLDASGASVLDYAHQHMPPHPQLIELLLTYAHQEEKAEHIKKGEARL